MLGKGGISVLQTAIFIIIFAVTFKPIEKETSYAALMKPFSKDTKVNRLVTLTTMFMITLLLEAK